MQLQNDGKAMQKITPCLWFDKNAEEAAKFYTSIFKNSKILSVSRYTEAGYDLHHMPAGTALTVEFALDGQTFTALNAGPAFKFNEAISFQVACDSQEEVDYYWEKLTEGGDPQAQQCGWLKDKFGVSWQILPRGVVEMMTDKDAQRSGRVMQALMQMKKLDLEKLRQAYEGR
jgi:predicted 3-demethylubiquinone-9 3-methyltransferase (glyoxalase superfamily)